MFVSRSIFEHELFATEPFDKRSAWLWLIAEAAWERRRVNLRRGFMVDVDRGEVAASMRFMAKAWKWKDHHRVGRFLALLEQEGMIKTRDTGDISVVAIVKYDLYQRPQQRPSNAP